MSALECLGVYVNGIRKILFVSLCVLSGGSHNRVCHSVQRYHQQSDLSSSTSCWVSFPVSADGSSSLLRSCSVGDDDLCVMLLGASIADTGSVNGPDDILLLVTLVGTS